jgi:hypothetical protein
MKRNYEEIALLSELSYDNSPMKGAVSTHVSFNIEARFNRGLEANVIAGGPWTYDATQVQGSEDAKYPTEWGIY